MVYSQEQLEKLNKEYSGLNPTFTELVIKLSEFEDKFDNDEAKKYIAWGVTRRLYTLKTCLYKVFTIFPPDRKNNVEKTKLDEVEIYIQAFIANMSGLFDNLGWAFVLENDLLGRRRDGKINKHGVGLFNPSTQEHLSNELNEYLNGTKIKSWYDEYSKSYRDSLLHRIPLYIPPYQIPSSNKDAFTEIQNEINSLDYSNLAIDAIGKNKELKKKQEKLSEPSFIFASSFTEEIGRPVFFHAQLLADFNTVEEIINKCIDYF